MDQGHALVTGAAGFIGSTLAQALVERSDHVTGVDCLTPYYARDQKDGNIAAVAAAAADLGRPRAFTYRQVDLRDVDVDALLDGVDVVYHLAAQPGVRNSWADGFATYVEHNITVTQRLLEAAVRRGVSRVVYASSSSVYGNSPEYPTRETTPLRPFSPYGVTKLAAEHLCSAYAHNFGLSTVSLRYFTVYGPRQRPDMAIHRLVEAALAGSTFPLYGSGEQVRDFTFVDDAVDATVRAGTIPGIAPGSVLNVAGGSSVSMRELVELVEEVTGGHFDLVVHAEQPGDVTRTGGDTTATNTVLGWAPAVALRAGLAAQVAWHRARRLIAA